MAPAIPLERPALGAIPVSYNMDEWYLNPIELKFPR